MFFPRSGRGLEREGQRSAQAQSMNTHRVDGLVLFAFHAAAARRAPLWFRVCSSCGSGAATTGRLPSIRSVRISVNPMPPVNARVDDAQARHPLRIRRADLLRGAAISRCCRLERFSTTDRRLARDCQNRACRPNRRRRLRGSPEYRRSRLSRRCRTCGRCQLKIRGC
jgi:hypothetical protein